MSIEVTFLAYRQHFDEYTTVEKVENRETFRKMYQNNGYQRGFVLENYVSGVKTYHLLDINS